MKLQLFHGRADPDQEMPDWGFDGPSIEQVAWLLGTYLFTLRVGFSTLEAAQKAHLLTGWPFCDIQALEIPVLDNMIVANQCFYGDFELIEEGGS